VGYYHCVSRVVDRRFIFGDIEKDRFVSLMREYEIFCGVQVLTYSVMDNHFHLLLAVPKRPDEPSERPASDTVVQMLHKLSGNHGASTAQQQLAALRQKGDAKGEAAWLARYHARMWDVSAFMKLLKQRFTQWYNRRVGREGTLWEARFKSVLVDGAGRALSAMAAYIDLNPVRAGIVADPKDYRWSGYGEAVAGVGWARQGIQALAQALQGGKDVPEIAALELYRTHLYLEGDERRETVGCDGRLLRGTLQRDAALGVLAAKGRLPLGDYMRCRVRYFCDGAAFGGQEFVESVFLAYRKRFGPRRKDGARRLKGVATDFFSLRDLRVEVFG